MRMKQGVSVRITCPHCGQSNDHKHDCPLGVCEYVSARIRHLLCPKCLKHEIDINELGYYECRSCRTQFTTIPVGDSVDRALIVDGGKCVRVSVLDSKGTGKFPLDQALTAVQDRLRAANKELQDD